MIKNIGKIMAEDACWVGAICNKRLLAINTPYYNGERRELVATDGKSLRIITPYADIFNHEEPANYSLSVDKTGFVTLLEKNPGYPNYQHFLKKFENAVFEHTLTLSKDKEKNDIEIVGLLRKLKAPVQFSMLNTLGVGEWRVYCVGELIKCEFGNKVSIMAGFRE
jgi:hypothetical protein